MDACPHWVLSSVGVLFSEIVFNQSKLKMEGNVLSWFQSNRDSWNTRWYCRCSFIYSFFVVFWFKLVGEVGRKREWRGERMAFHSLLLFLLLLLSPLFSSLFLILSSHFPLSFFFLSSFSLLSFFSLFSASFFVSFYCFFHLHLLCSQLHLLLKSTVKIFFKKA